MADSTVAMRVFRAVVVRTETLTPSLRRVVFGGDGLAGFASTGVGDEYLRVVFPRPGSTEPELPTVTGGNLDYGSVDTDLMRTYTVRSHDASAGEVTVDFVVHDGGVAASWARRAQPGDVVALSSPTGMYDPPAGLAWQILVGDCTAVPAALRILETIPPGVRTRLVLEVPGTDHRLEVPARPGVEVTWLQGGNGHGASRLEQVVRSLPRPDGTGYVWVAGEAKALRGVRRYLRHELGLPPSAYKSVGYWIERAEEWRQRYDALDDAVRRELEALWEDGGDPEEIEDVYDDRLARLGL